MKLFSNCLWKKLSTGDLGGNRTLDLLFDLPDLQCFFVFINKNLIRFLPLYKALYTQCFLSVFRKKSPQATGNRTHNLMFTSADVLFLSCSLSQSPAFSWGRSELTDRNVELYPQFFLELITTQLRFYMVSPQLSLLVLFLVVTKYMCMMVYSWINRKLLWCFLQERLVGGRSTQLQNRGQKGRRSGWEMTSSWSVCPRRDTW